MEIVMRFIKHWRAARRRARTIKWMRRVASERGVPTWYMTDDEVMKSVAVACAIGGLLAEEIAASMKRLSSSAAAARLAMQDFARAVAQATSSV